MKELTQKIFDFLRLKRVLRSGWSYYGYGPEENVASHIFGTAILTLLIGREIQRTGVELDLLKAIIMALIHEVGETRLGDLHLEARRFLGEEHVINTEQEVAKSVLKDEYLESIFKEFEEGKSREAKLVHDIDRLELLIEAKERSKPESYRIVNIFNTAKNKGFMSEFSILKKLSEHLIEE